MSSKPETPESNPTEISLRHTTRSDTEHRSYLLRLWRSGGDGDWRASLQAVHNGERHMFADVESLLAFLVEQLRPPSIAS